MRSIGILADTHGFLDPSLFNYFRDCDELWHAGDFGKGIAEALAAFKPLKGVFGNIDGSDVRSVFKKDMVFSCEGVNIFMTHIGGYPGHYDARVKSLLQSLKPQIFITGHSHIIKIMRDPKLNDLLHINPGAAGKVGFHIMRTVVRLKIDGKRIFDVEVIELGKKSAVIKK
ncbi:MAG: metallophosphoesterase family protein [Chitinophagales bacterium]|jgi:putative phosphoesterase|nr:metallophosphoesterase family protein [Chitinophagales bacterium]